MAKKVKTIPATLDLFKQEPILKVKKRKTAGYARVSTFSEEQATSYESQMDYYKNYIENRPDWEFVGMYSDEGISATNTKRRDGFRQMIQDALEGKIDLIITKSVSRFARNTVDSLQTVRRLKDKGVEVYFEKENIWTLDAKGELLITIMSSLAQEESRSISENTTWGRRKQFASGKGSIAFSRFLGYDKDFRINEEEAKTVKLIYKLYISGYSAYAISKELMKRGLKTATGLTKWHSSTILSILRNEKYKGDALWQKSYITDFLQKKSKINEGEIPQYYVEEHHAPIVSPEEFDFVQAEMNRRKKENKAHGSSIFSHKIKCGNCGAWYSPVVWHSNDRFKRKIYRCVDKYKTKGEPCKSPHFTEEEIKRIFLKALNSFVKIKKDVRLEVQSMIEMFCTTATLEIEKNNAEDELENLSKKMYSMIKKNAKIAQNQEEYLEIEASVRNEYIKLNNRIKELEENIMERNNRKVVLENFIKSLDYLDGEITEFSEELWVGLLDYIIIKDKSHCTVVFKGGSKLDV